MLRNKYDTAYWESFSDTEECDRRRDDLNLQQQLDEYEKLSINLPQSDVGGVSSLPDMVLQPQPVLGRAG